MLILKLNMVVYQIMLQNRSQCSSAQGLSVQYLLFLSSITVSSFDNNSGYLGMTVQLQTHLRSSLCVCECGCGCGCGCVDWCHSLEYSHPTQAVS